MKNISDDITESVVEQCSPDWLRGLGYEVLSGLAIAPGEAAAARSDYKQVFLFDRLQTTLADLNPKIPLEGLQEALRKLRLISHPTLIENNRAFHRLLVEGVDVEFRNREGQIAHDKVWLIDFANSEANEFLAVNQFSVEEGHFNRRADVVVFINGIPLAVLELKNITDANTTIRGAFNQLQTYKAQIPSLFHSNALLVISDGHEARLGTVTSDWERFMTWRTITGRELVPPGSLQLETLLKGVFDKHRLLDLIRNFVVFEDDGDKVVKKLAGYHQFHAVNKAVETTLRAAGVPSESGGRRREETLSKSPAESQSLVTSSPTKEGVGDRRAGVIWHTQGSGKSLSMVFYAGKIVQHAAMVKHWEARYAAMEGKAMVVCMTRRICVELYKAIQKLRPAWHHDDDHKGTMKIVMSGSASDHLDWQQHIRSKARREELAKAFKNPKKPFRIVIVRDMWLTGFDAPSLHTMYVDKPMRGHGLNLPKPKFASFCAGSSANTVIRRTSRKRQPKRFWIRPNCSVRIGWVSE
jgi:type I site-specific restriction-modification system R (restriction) subunit